MTKRITWAYPNSPNACRYGYGTTGCWCVEVNDWGSIAGFAKQDAELAIAAAEKLTRDGNNDPIEWAPYGRKLVDEYLRRRNAFL